MMEISESTKKLIDKHLKYKSVKELCEMLRKYYSVVKFYSF